MHTKIWLIQLPLDDELPCPVVIVINVHSIVLQDKVIGFSSGTITAYSNFHETVVTIHLLSMH